MRINVVEFIKLTPESNNALDLRLKIDKYWIYKLKFLTPRGFNILD